PGVEARNNPQVVATVRQMLFNHQREQRRNQEVELPWASVTTTAICVKPRARINGADEDLETRWNTPSRQRHEEPTRRISLGGSSPSLCEKGNIREGRLGRGSTRPLLQDDSNASR